jgi:hypothetical protein
MNCPSCFIPNSDPRIVYGGAWSLDVVSAPSFIVHRSASPGATVQLTFNGEIALLFFLRATELMGSSRYEDPRLWNHSSKQLYLQTAHSVLHD